VRARGTQINGQRAAVVAGEREALHSLATARAGHGGIVPDRTAGLRYDPPMTFPAVTLTIHLCPACAHVWFDGHEDLHLAPAAVLRLFEAMGRAAAGAGVSVGGVPARVLFAAPDRIAVEVPRVAEPGPTPVRAAWSPGATLFVHVGVPMATGLHQVDSPAVDADGRVYAAFSGPRGQDTPVSVYRVEADGGREPFVEGIVNATGLAFSPGGVLHVSSRYDGVVYRAPDGSLFVGDRTGTLHHVSADGLRTEVFATLPPSVAAYHLAMGPDEQLYVTGPTLATHDAVYRFDASGRHEVLDRTFGRPQGLGFDANGVLHVVEALAGVSGIYRCPAGATRRLVVSGPSLVGVAFLPGGDLVAATADTLYRFPSIP
jgi:sugar lactone lactonase YvrE